MRKLSLGAAEGLPGTNTGPRMAKLSSRLPFFVCCTVGALALALVAGCQEQPVVDQLPCANFNGPLVQAPSPEYVPPLIRTVPKVPETVKPPQPQVASIPREWVPSARKPDGWRWIVIHHSATTVGGARAFDRMHREKGWDELGYHFVIGNGTDTSDGQVEVGSRWGKQKWGAHTKTPDNQYNNFGVGICLVGNFDNQRPTASQMRSLARLTAYLMKTYHIPADRIVGHRDCKSTDCPGRHVNVAEVRRMANQMLASSGEPSEAVARTASAELLVDEKR